MAANFIEAARRHKPTSPAAEIQQVDEAGDLTTRPWDGGSASPVQAQPVSDPVGERLILLTDGVTSRRTDDGGTFGVDGLRRALNDVEHATAAGTAIALQRAVTSSWREPLEDDATIVVLRMD